MTQAAHLAKRLGQLPIKRPPQHRRVTFRPFRPSPPPFAVKIQGDASSHTNLRAVAAVQLPNAYRKLPRNCVVSFLAPENELKRRESKALYRKGISSRTMLSWVQIVSTPTADTPGTCLLLHFDSRRYLFGSLAEGTQRAFSQRNVGLTKIEHVFLSGVVNWANVGGILGLILSLADVLTGSRNALAELNQQRSEKGLKAKFQALKETSLSLHGGLNLAYTLATGRHFIFRKGTPIRSFEVKKDPRLADPENILPDWEDDCINVWYVPLYQDGNNDIHDGEIMLGQPSGGRPTTPKKRDYNEMESNETSAVAKSVEQERADREAVSAVVEHMFNSEWKLDALVETTLHQVQLPAKIFMRDAERKIVRYEGPLPDEDPDVPDIPVLVRTPWPAATIERLPQTSQSKQSICYIVKNRPIRGKFNPVKAEELGVAKRDNKLLTAGQSVQGKDGITVTPEMVMGEDNKGSGFIVADIPDASYIDSFVKRPEWANEKLLANIATCYWILGRGIIDDLRIQQFIGQYSGLHHVVSSPDVSPNMLALESPAKMVTKLHLIDPVRFPLPLYDNKARDIQKTIPSAEVGRLGKQMHMTPRLRFSDENAVPFPNTAFTAKSMSKEALGLAKAAAEEVADSEFLAKIEEDEKDIPNRDAEIIPLGTGSALPSRYRNVSSTLVRVPGVGNYLFDCGENTIGQMRRTFGEEQTAEIISDLRVILISHLHADHHLGTASIIKAWHDRTKSATPERTLTLSCTLYMRKWLAEYSAVEDLGYARLRFLDGVGAHTPDLAATGLSKIENCLVDHCHQAMASVFTWPSGLKIAYSGDCRPSDEFVRIGRGATLLIHESTFDDDKAGDALAKKHCTLSEALDVGRRMGARRVLLTHFSQRYAKISLHGGKIGGGGSVEEGAQGVKDQAVLMAFDQMRVRLGDFRKAERFLPAIKSLFDDEQDE
jgi:ribonuclease Z